MSHTFSVKISEAMLLRAYSAIQQKREAEKYIQGLTSGKMYALEVSVDLPDGIDAHNLQMDIVEETFEEQHSNTERITP